jgi:transposase-like protein
MEKEMSDEPRRKWDRWPVEFRQRALERMKTCPNVAALIRELGVSKSLLYAWKHQAEGRWVQAREPGAAEDSRDRRVRELEQKVGELEGVIGRKALELDFFAGALRRIKEARQKRGSSGEMASTRKSGSGCNRKAD